MKEYQNAFSGYMEMCEIERLVGPVDCVDNLKVKKYGGVYILYEEKKDDK